jgi:hypothetical protein
MWHWVTAAQPVVFANEKIAPSGAGHAVQVVTLALLFGWKNPDWHGTQTAFMLVPA